MDILFETAKGNKSFRSLEFVENSEKNYKIWPL